VKPFAYEEVEQIILAELGVRISKAFSRFDIEPIAAASLGQVHLAALRDGRQVAVKVQRPDIRRQIADDFEVLAEIAAFLDEHTEKPAASTGSPRSWPSSAPPSSRSSTTSARRRTSSPSART
jgi:predicted unusual protein kinase regulating ubiquinone biosynthesis (AarF/ABC1/UbiB family)